MLTVTEKAATEIKKICSEQNLNGDDVYLRLGAKGGGCSGFQYSW